MLPPCPFSSTCVTPGISRHTHSEEEPCIYDFTRNGDTCFYLWSSLSIIAMTPVRRGGIHYKMKKRQLRDRGFRRNSAAWDTSIARTTGFMWPNQECYSLLRRTKSDSCGTQWLYKYVAVDMYATLCTFVGRNLINSRMRGKKWPCITRWIGPTITRNRTQNMSGEWRACWVVYHSVFVPSCRNT